VHFVSKSSSSSCCCCCRNWYCYDDDDDDDDSDDNYVADAGETTKNGNADERDHTAGILTAFLFYYWFIYITSTSD